MKSEIEKLEQEISDLRAEIDRNYIGIASYNQDYGCDPYGCGSAVSENEGRLERLERKLSALKK